ncbi:MAG TPA: lysophospholipid acyltransferase family protein [Candidatus Limnocylindrales bacterium]
MTGAASPAAGATSAKKRGFRKRFVDALTAYLVIGTLKLVEHLPERLAWSLAGFAGAISYRLSASRRDRARRSLRRITEWAATNERGPEYVRAAATDPKALEALVRKSFVHHVLSYVEMARAPRFTPAWVNDRLVVENMAEVDEWMVPGRAFILVGMHFGAIEVPAIFAVSRLQRIVSPMESISNARIQRYIYETRDTVGIRIIGLDQPGPDLLATLRRNEAVGLVADRMISGGGVEVELFGATTKIPAGPVLLAAETGAQIYVSAVRRVGRGRYRGGVRQLELAEGASRRERSRAMAREEARAFEEIIVEAPEQWLSLFFPIWPDLEQTAMPHNGDRA